MGGQDAWRLRLSLHTQTSNLDVSMLSMRYFSARQFRRRMKRYKMLRPIEPSANHVKTTQFPFKHVEKSRAHE